MRIPLLVIALSLYHFSFSQTSSTLLGARASGLGNASSCLKDEWAFFNNPGGLAGVNNPVAAFTYEARPQFSAFNRMGALVATPSKYGVAALGVYKFGDDLFNEQIASAAFSNQFGLASLGLKVNYIQYNASGFGRKDIISVNFGGIAQLTPQLCIGAHIINVNQPMLTNDGDEKLPTILIAGISIKPNDVLLILTEIEKDLLYKATFKAAIEYEAYKKMILRTGFNLCPQAGFLGIGFRPGKFTLDYAYNYYPESGSRHQASVSYKFKSMAK